MLLAYIDNENEQIFYVKGHNDNINQNNSLQKLLGADIISKAST